MCPVSARIGVQRTAETAPRLSEALSLIVRPRRTFPKDAAARAAYQRWLYRRGRTLLCDFKYIPLLNAAVLQVKQQARIVLWVGLYTRPTQGAMLELGRQMMLSQSMGSWRHYA